MQKTLKRITLILAAITAVICLGVFASACQGNKEKDVYTITLVYQDTNEPVDGTVDEITVQVCWTKLDHTGGSCYETYKVGTDGKAQVKFPELKPNTLYHLKVNYLPEEYTYNDDLCFLSKAGDTTIAIYKK